jgi:hypothetical protein
MIDYVTGYRARGNPALVAYANEDSITGAAEVLAAMLLRSPYMHQYAPSLERPPENYPQDRPPDVAEVLFWAEDDLPGLKPTITITHEVVYSPPELPDCTLIVAKQLYADHYLDRGISRRRGPRWARRRRIASGRMLRLPRGDRTSRVT